MLRKSHQNQSRLAWHGRWVVDFCALVCVLATLGRRDDFSRSTKYRDAQTEALLLCGPRESAGGIARARRRAEQAQKRTQLKHASQRWCGRP